jgi:prevent-host-death family protein
VVDLKKYTLDVDLKQGVVPISKAASSLAALIKRSRAQHQPIIVTQKGYPTGVILDVELFSALRALADQLDGIEGLEEPAEAEVEDQA